MKLRPMLNLILTLVAFGLLLCLLLRWYEPRLIYFPQQKLDATPTDADLPYDDVWLTTADDVRIHGWLVPAPTTAPAPPTLLFFHGNAGNISHRLEKLALFHQLGAQTLIIDYRGYGQSAGAPDEPGTYADAEAAYSFLTETRHLKPDTVILYGESLGSAVAVELATRHPVAGVILEEPLASVAAIGRRLFPFLPVRWLVRNQYDSLAKIAALHAPLLVFHSPQDEVIPFAHGRRLFDAASEPKTFVSLHGGHNDAFLVSAATYREALAEFLASPQR